MAKNSQSAKTGRGATKTASASKRATKSLAGGAKRTGKGTTKSSGKTTAKSTPRARSGAVKSPGRKKGGATIVESTATPVRVKEERRLKVAEPRTKLAEPRVRVERLGPVEREELRELGALVTRGDEITIVTAGDRKVTISGALLDGLGALGKLFDALDRGPSVTVVADDDQAELTSQEAADLLHVSRPYVVKLARDGVLAHRRVGNRHRFTLADVLDYRDQMRAVREEALAELAPADGYTAEDF